MKIVKKDIEFHNMHDLEKFGVNPLTGEACAFSLRMLCDLNQEGKDLMEEFLGGAFVTASNWNSMVNGKKAIRSIMISKSTFQDLYKYICWKNGCEYIVIDPSGNVDGYPELSEEQLEEFSRDEYKLYFSPAVKGQPSVNGRNVHAASGRTE